MANVAELFDQVEYNKNQYYRNQSFLLKAAEYERSVHRLPCAARQGTMALLKFNEAQ